MKILRDNKIQKKKRMFISITIDLEKKQSILISFQLYRKRKRFAYIERSANSPVKRM